MEGLKEYEVQDLFLRYVHSLATGKVENKPHPEKNRHPKFEKLHGLSIPSSTRFS